ncbi:MAG: SpoIIIAH-like family protein [Lachnospiraceae bacterium]|nr:SpoIIIAH-like family protein [Lachnospiraceae bacterium]
MKNIWKKNQIIITALAVLIAVAGYFNFSGKDSEMVMQELTGNDAVSEDTQKMTVSDSGEITYSDADATEEISEEEEEVAKTDTADITEETELAENIEEEDGKEEEGQETEESQDTTGEAVLVNASVNSGFFETARLNREQTRAKNKETLLSIVDNANLSEKEKKSALKAMVAMTDIAERENATEMLLAAKGFEDVVVSIVDGSADVIVNANNLTSQQIAQIEDIVKRKTDIKAENIVISPVGVNNGK